MQRRVDGENHAKQQQAANQHCAGVLWREVHAHGNRSGQQGQQQCPAGSAAPARHLLPAGQPWRYRLHQPVADHPTGHKATDQPEVPAQRAAQVHRQGDHKPHITGTEQKQPRCGEQVDGAALGQQLPEFGLAAGAPQVLLQQAQTDQPHHRQRHGHRQHRAGKAEQHQQRTTQEKADALQGIFGAGENGHPLVQRALLLLRHQQLDGALGAHLVQVLGDAGQRLRRHHPGYAEDAGR